MPARPAPEVRSLIAWTIAMVVAAGVLLWLLYLVRHVLLLLYVSALLATGFSPLVRLIERNRVLPIGSRRLPRWLAILSVYLAILGTLAGIAALILPPLVTQARAFFTQLPRLAARAQEILLRRGILSEQVSLGDVVQQAPAGSDAVGTVLLTLWGFVGGLAGLATILILTFYLLVDAENLFGAFVRLFPRPRRRHVRAVAAEIGVKVSAWLSGQLILAGVIGVTSAVGLGLLGVPYFYVLALIAAVGELIPYVGPLLAAVPALAVALGVSGKLALAVAGLYFVQQQLENYLLVPKIMEQQVGLSPVAVIIALLLGATLLGFVGAILAVPTAAIVQVLFQELLPDDESAAPTA